MQQTYFQKASFTLAGVLLVVFVTLSALPLTASAQQVDYEPQTIEEQIIYLLGMIAQLQELLDLMKEREAESGVVSGGGGRADVDVDTLSARDIEDDEAELRGEIDFNGEKEARVWFEYGEDDDDLDERTTKRRVTDFRGDELTFTETVDDLDEDERYYFRAVAEDENGDRTYGSIRSFTTDEDSSSSSGGDFELIVRDTLVSVGDEVDVEWEVPREDVGSRNWIGLYERGADDEDYLDWTYIATDTDGEVTFEMESLGTFEFRLFLSNSYVEEVTSRLVTVQ